ncbi:MAG: DUF2490 domain-containing protein [Bacteroidales bacterium]|nr:DUF2490 domain-containing protein [Bacteroidales bacterium]
MKRIICLLAVLLPVAGFAQGTVNDLETDFGARFGVSFNKKIVKGFHVVADGEIRLSDDFSSLGRYQAGLGLSYKINPVVKVGAGYQFIEKMNSSSEWKPRHRFYADGTATLKAGFWSFSLKERLQLTSREVNNVYQNNPNSLMLKSRFKVSYKGFASLTPYGYVEVRNVLNDPACSATWSTTSQAYGDYSFLGYKDAYVNRVRGSLGTEWKLSKRHSIDFYILGDYCYDKNIDTNSGGTKLKSLTYDQAFNTAFCVGYQFSF